MTSPLVQLTERLQEIQAAIEAELDERRRAFRYRLEQRRVVFDAEVAERHREAREKLSAFLAR